MPADNSQAQALTSIIITAVTAFGSGTLISIIVGFWKWSGKIRDAAKAGTSIKAYHRRLDEMGRVLAAERAQDIRELAEWKSEMEQRVTRVEERAGIIYEKPRRPRRISQIMEIAPPRAPDTDEQEAVDEDSGDDQDR